MNLTKYNNNIKNYSLCIYFFYSPECINIYNEIKNIQTSHKSKIYFVDISKVENHNLLLELNIKSYPSFKIYKNTKLIENIIGTYNNISSIINLHIM